MADLMYSTSVCRGEVRFHGGKMQQLFFVTDYVGARPTGVRLDWRDVPVEADDRGKDWVLEERIAKAIRAECLLIFGSSWSLDNAHRLARAAIVAMRDE